MFSSWKELTEEKYKEIVKGSKLELLTLSEIIEMSINLDKFWKFTGAYYKLAASGVPIIIIDREQSVGGYNNSELTLSFKNNNIKSNDRKFKTLICERIVERAKKLITAKDDVINDDEDTISK